MTAPADELRAAAAKLQKNAQAATPGPWDSMSHSHMEDGCRCLSCHETTGWLFTHTRSCDETEVASRNEDARDCPVDVMTYEDAEYAITVHPEVGKALAKLLEQAAEALTGTEVPDDEPALTVARLINGGQP